MAKHPNPRELRTKDLNAPNARVKGQRGSVQNKLRYELYRNAIVRANTAYNNGYYFETISLCDSLITDRLEAYTQHLMHFDEETQPTATLQQSLSALGAAQKDKGIKADAELKSLRKRLIEFSEKRNEAIHNFVVVKNENANKTADDRLNEAQEYAKKGLDLFIEVKKWTDKNIAIREK